MRASKVPPKELRRVVIAASVGNVIEWYDFYIFGSLAAILAVKFFEKGHPVAAFLSTMAIFSVGFLIRPLGAFVAYFNTGSLGWALAYPILVPASCSSSPYS